jgi:hypothetical protein
MLLETLLDKQRVMFFVVAYPEMPLFDQALLIPALHKIWIHSIRHVHHDCYLV